MKEQKNILTDIGINSTISNIQYPISNIQYHLENRHLLSLPSGLLFLLFLFVPVFFLSACVDLGTSSSTTKKYTVSFQTDGGSALPPSVVTEGTTLSQTITAPTKAASGGTTYYFGDWYTVGAATGHTGKTKYDYTKPVTGSMTLYARWYTEQPADKAALQTLITNLGATADLNHIDVRKITDMSQVFERNATFNGDVSGWDVSGVTNMERMFAYADKFNQPIGAWDVSDVTNMQRMFFAASVFNQPIGDWNVSDVRNMQLMFSYADEFNQPIGAWDVSDVNNMNQMFFSARVFDQDISGWTVSQVTDYTHILTGSRVSTAHTPPRFR